ncbi:MAG: putative transporter protein [Bacteroidetes bacterium]|jgi:ABC-type antimicrobial peptide transport system permease subunit|nr:putative transporter protein [Bacteroidota bacterium]
MKIPLKYSLRSLWTRRLTTVLTMIGIALVVFVFAAVLMMAHGLQKTLVATGSDDNMIVLRKSASGEITSIIGREEAAIITSLPQVARLPDGKALASGEVVVIVNLQYVGTEGYANIMVRGVSPEASLLRPQARLTSGRLFRFGSREVIVGSSVARRFQGAGLGERIKFGGDLWEIVGIFDTEGSGFDSEIWGDGDQLGQAFERSVFSTVTVRLTSAAQRQEFLTAFEADRRLQTLEAKPEKQFYEEQSELMAMFIRILGIAITVIFSVGAIIGAMITMYAAVSNRTVEIGTLRSLGFRRRSVLSAFLVESFLLSMLGGLAGLLLASILQFFSVSMINFASFSEIAFSFALSPEIILMSLLFAVIMGIVGGFLPAVRAARLDILSALRAA